ncbi:MAG TPA: YetF domain-containing protein [Bacteroidota bacterium]|nr:YetF domain-containing protein [Bacteroidota bacterium]
MGSHYFDIIFRSAAVYAAVIAGLRLLGKKHVAQLSIIDLVLILLISNAVQNAMVGDDSSLLGGLIAAATLLAMNFLLTLIGFRSRRAGALFEGTPTLLVHAGRAIPEHLAHEEITMEELERVVREHGIGSLQEVKTAVMEVDGTISVVPVSGEDRRIEIYRRRRPKPQIRNR